MYPNLYYVFKDWFGVEWKGLFFLNTFGLFVAIAFIVAALVISAELRRKEKQGLLGYTEEMITVGKPASIMDLFLNGITGFIFGYKLFGLFFNKPEDIDAQEYIFSREGNFLGGLLVAAVLVGIKWWEKKKQQLKTPERRPVRIWPHDRVGDIIILGLIFGILGAKLFDNFEHWDEFVADPIGRIFSQSGLTFYGGLITAGLAIAWYARKKRIHLRHLMDAAAPALMIAYAIGRIGCQVSGDGDWGVFNSAYTSDNQGNISVAAPGDFEKKLQQYAGYFTDGERLDSTGKPMPDSLGQRTFITDRTYKTLADVPHKYFKGPGFLPKWFYAYSYPQNVNSDGILMPGITDEHKRVLPQPVFPTPLYEVILCTLLFLFLWAIRTRISTPLVVFGIYLVVNGVERFLVESIRVNKLYNVMGLYLSQAQLIAIGLVLAGLATIIFARKKYRTT
jgi:phosphatidylglycerol:prolipoprotein diacylglycerol transferase